MPETTSAPATRGNDEFEPIPKSPAEKLVIGIAVVAPFVGLVLAMYFLWGWGFRWIDLALLAVMYLGTGLGITMGYHRLFAHRSFETIRPVKFVLGVLGSMALEGPLFHWIATHRRHHQHSDSEEDPHSPHTSGRGWWGFFVGLWHSHVGWLFTPSRTDIKRYAKDLIADRMMRFINNLFPLWVTVGLLLPALVGGLVTQTWTGALLGFLWGGAVRLFLVHHVTWSINSICHVWGSKPFQSDDESRNNVLCGVLALGEGWHNNHHAFPKSARHGLFWWQFDVSYMIIRAMETVGLAWRVNTPGADKLLAKRAV